MQCLWGGTFDHLCAGVPRRLEEARGAQLWCEMWIALIPQFGGVHHGYFLPDEGHSDVALGLFSFSSLAEYEAYRFAAASHDGALAADRFKRETGCIRSWDRRFFKPLLPGPDR